MASIFERNADTLDEPLISPDVVARRIAISDEDERKRLAKLLHDAADKLQLLRTAESYARIREVFGGE